VRRATASDTTRGIVKFSVCLIRVSVRGQRQNTEASSSDGTSCGPVQVCAFRTADTDGLLGSLTALAQRTLRTACDRACTRLPPGACRFMPVDTEREGPPRFSRRPRTSRVCGGRGGRRGAGDVLRVGSAEAPMQWQRQRSGTLSSVHKKPQRSQAQLDHLTNRAAAAATAAAITAAARAARLPRWRRRLWRGRCHQWRGAPGSGLHLAAAAHQ